MKPKNAKKPKRWISDEEMKKRIAIPQSEFCDEQLATFSPWLDAPMMVTIPAPPQKKKRKR